MSTTSEIITALLQFRNQIKMYHWKSPTYSKHKASDDLLQKMEEHIDKFVEVMSGGREERPPEVLHLEFRSLNDKTIIGYLKDFKSWLMVELPGLLYEHETDLMNLKDELLAEVNRGVYLLSMK